MIYAVRLTDQTRQAIYDQARYIAVDRHAPDGAARWLNRVMAAIDSWRNPRAGVRWPLRMTHARKKSGRSP